MGGKQQHVDGDIGVEVVHLPFLVRVQCKLE